jgi:predicted RNA-binding protein with PIN domain
VSAPAETPAEDDPTGPDVPGQWRGPLPDGVRTRVVALAADGLGALKPDEVPASLRAFRRFAPSRRAKLAATPLATAVERDPVFRQRVAARVREALPDLAAALDAGVAPLAADPLDVAAAAYVLRPAHWPELIEAAHEHLRREVASARASRDREAVTKLEQQLLTARTHAREDHERLKTELRGAKDEIAALRHKLHDAREAARHAREEASAAIAARDQGRAASTAAESDAQRELRRLRQRLAETETALETARRATREGRAHTDARVRLLLDAVVEAGQGLRRELALPPASVRPADAVAGVRPGERGVDDVAVRARGADDPALLDDLLSLPQVHLVIDGYNVTKTGYGTLPLERQRDRLVTGLGALAARSGAEVTVCLDGAALDGPVAVSAPRGVRVLFSRPGEIADELIRRLVAAEPAGRPLVVVSSDREVADGVRRKGARPVPSVALLRLLDRG